MTLSDDGREMPTNTTTLVDLVRELSALPSGLTVTSAAINLRTDAGTRIDYRFPAKAMRDRSAIERGEHRG